MKRIIATLLLSMTLAVAATQAQAYSTTLTEYAFNVDGAVVDSLKVGDVMPGTPLFNTTTGLGTISFSFSAGTHSVSAFFDHEINLLEHGFTPDFGAVFGTAKTGQSWQIDEPGYGNNGYTGSIYGDFANNSLQNKNLIPANGDDASMALGWDFTIASGDTATVTFILDQYAPIDSFYLMQLDGLTSTGDKIYLSSTLEVFPGNPNNPVPEPSTFLLFGSAMAGLALYRKKTRKPA